MIEDKIQHPPITDAPPPYNREEQPWPGLASKMDPRPDHGEQSYRGSCRLAGRKALITGGDSGIGRAAAIAYAREGADVAINYLPSEEPDAREVIALIEGEARIGLAIAGDIRDETFCQKLVTQAVKGLGGLDILVCNAARQQLHASILDISTEQFDWTMKTNVYAPFWIIRAALPYLKVGSAIIGVASEQADDPSPCLYDYAQTKAATVSYVKSLAKQIAVRGIRVNAVSPGTTWTPLLVCGEVSSKALQRVSERAPFNRMMQPVELSSLFVQLAVREPKFSTGQVYYSSPPQKWSLNTSMRLAAVVVLLRKIKHAFRRFLGRGRAR